MPAVSIVIRTKNEAKFLPACLDMIKNQSYQDYEVIVVDSGSSDQTLSIAKKYGCRIVSMNPAEFTYGHALNVGINAAKSKIAVIISGHCLPIGRDWLRTLLQSFESNPALAGVYGRQIAYPEASPMDHRGSLEAYPNGDTPVITTDFRFSNAHSAILKSAWKKLHFNEDIPYAEDMDWVKTIKSWGMIIIYEPRAVVFHSHQETFTSLYRRFNNENTAMIKMSSELARSGMILVFLLRYIRSVLMDYLFLLSHPHSLPYFIKWIIFTPIHRLAVYYGQYKANQLARQE